MKLLFAVVLLLLLTSCGSTAEETRPPDTEAVSQILPETVSAETEETEKTSVLSEQDQAILTEAAAEKALIFLISPLSSVIEPPVRSMR